MTDFAAENYYSRHDGTEDTEPEGDDLTPLAPALGLTFELAHPRECTEGVTRRDEFQPCDKPAVAVRLDPESGEPYPVCARHARADMVPLPDLIAAVRAQVAAEILCGENWTPRGPLSCYGCPVCADVWESEATCTHWPAIQWAARTAGGADA